VGPCGTHYGGRGKKPPPRGPHVKTTPQKKGCRKKKENPPFNTCSNGKTNDQQQVVENQPRSYRRRSREKTNQSGKKENRSRPPGQRTETWNREQGEGRKPVGHAEKLPRRLAKREENATGKEGPIELGANIEKREE